MLTRMGRFDFATKLKITPQSLIPGFGPSNRSTLLSFAEFHCTKKIKHAHFSYALAFFIGAGTVNWKFSGGEPIKNVLVHNA